MTAPVLSVAASLAHLDPQGASTHDPQGASTHDPQGASTHDGHDRCSSAAAGQGISRPLPSLDTKVAVQATDTEPVVFSARTAHPRRAPRQRQPVVNGSRGNRGVGPYATLICASPWTTSPAA